MSVTVSYSITAAETYLDLIQGPGGTEIDLVALANGGIAATSTNGGTTDLDILTPAGNNAGGALDFNGTRGSVDQMANGDLVAVWQTADGDSNFSIRDSVTGASKGEGFFAISSSDPDVANLENGKNLFVCADNGDISILIPQNPGVYSLFKASSGATDERPSVTALEGGGFAVAWSATRGFTTEVWYAVYENNGATRLAATLLETTGTVFHDVSVTGMADGGFAIAYEDTADAGGNTDIRLATFSDLGTVVDRVSVSDPDSTMTSYNDVRPYLTRMDNGLLAVSYTRDYVGQVVSPAIGPGPIPTGYEDDDTFVRVYDAVNGVVSAAGEVDAGQNPRLNVRDSAVAELGDGHLAVVHTNVANSDAQGEVLDVVRKSVGDGANDVIMGDRLVDIMQGGGGNDTYYVDNLGDTVIELNETGVDLVKSSVTFSLAGQYIENLTLTGKAAINGTGNSFSNTIVGNSAANTINGGTGADKMAGGGGNDTYFVDNVGDTVTEANVIGVDRVNSSVTFSLAGQYVENLTLAGKGTINATGNSFNNTIVGNSAANLINGGGGGDKMIGGGGNDTYTVDNVGDTVIEANVTGVDLVRSSVTFSLAGQYTENLTLTGSTAINGTGNSSANVIIGNAGANVISGGTNIDKLTGGAGADTFVFNTALGASDVDTITDFKVVDDTVRLDDAVFTKLSVGTLSSKAFWSNTTGLAHDGDDRIIYETDSGKLFYDADGTGATAGVHFATVAIGLVVTNADFVIV